MNHADRLALFTLNKLSEIFSTWTKAWERLSNTHSDQIIAQHVIFAYFIKVSRLHLCVTIWTCCLQRYLGSLQEKAIKIHVANGAGVDFPSLILPSEAVWGCRNCWAADTAVALSVLCLSALHQAPNGFVSPWLHWYSRWTVGPCDNEEYGSTGQHSLLQWPEHSCAKKSWAALKCILFYIAWEYPPPQGDV